MITMIRAYHNVAVDSVGRPLGILDGYRPEHPVALVFETDIPIKVETPAEAVEIVWMLLNVGDLVGGDDFTPDRRAVTYRERGNRSLSVGDVVEIDGQFYAAGQMGFNSLDGAPTVTDDVPDYMLTAPIITKRA
jgi:hypothetical protein